MMPLLMMAIGVSTPTAPMPASAFTSAFKIQINRGPAGELPSGGCMELAVMLDADGRPRETGIVRSSRLRNVDMGVLHALKEYRFDTTGLADGVAWTVLFSWSKDGQRTRLSNACVDLG
ncbi:hypothetical protein J7J08_01605 [Stenotrophomonas sp. ISL-67]|uniref:hypothetical protein n=1 Tax=Stenotrophomonas sp. ISL-67 TaxID=2819171 RepID=UPI001BECA046|nr:hypothetical protein [Stenotrophomonas sp. ISL-67]MBT2766331.1 hypothetical protein [Stenotrophomonas sp. ISL-67]